ncbi:MAG: hypothetical protein KC476_10550, partial [Cyanobacteria bacterium HKST-UBA06]|nr:hypothetical protein [Cyanobacteria bacterium HKST-UBA06]
KLELEMAGCAIISGLLDEFVPAAMAFIETRDPNRLSKPHRKILRLINFPLVGLDEDDPADDTLQTGQRVLYDQLIHQSPYDILLRVTDYVSGMTDDYATDMYRKLQGIAHV